MSKDLIERSTMYGIGDAIREMVGVETTYKPESMPAAIRSIVGATLGTKTITANGEYDAEDDDLDGYSGVTVAVANSYAAADEGKVVSNGALVAQTAHAEVTQNGTIDTTLNNSVTVNVSSGGSSRVYIIDPDYMSMLAATTVPSNNKAINPNASDGGLFFPCAVLGHFQNDTVVLLKSNNLASIRIRNSNNKQIQFFVKIPAACTKVYFDTEGDGTSQSYPFYNVYFVDALGLTGYYSENVMGTTLKTFVLTTNAKTKEEIEAQTGLTITMDTNVKFARQTVVFDISDINVDCYMGIWACKSYVYLHPGGLYAEVE